MRLSRVVSPFAGGSCRTSSSLSLRKPLPSRFTSYVSMGAISLSVCCFHWKMMRLPSGDQRTPVGS